MIFGDKKHWMFQGKIFKNIWWFYSSCRDSGKRLAISNWKLKARAEDLDISDKVTEKKSNTLKETQNNYKIVDESTVHYINVLLRISKSTLELKN